MNRVFRIDFYPLDWLTLTAHMRPAQRGIFINICAMIYANRKPIENDHKHIARACNCSPRLIRAIIDELVSMGDLIINSAGKISQKRCERELESKRIAIENGMNGGRKSNENRSISKKNNDIELSHNENSPSSPSPPHPTPSNSSNELFTDAPSQRPKKFDVKEFPLPAWMPKPIWLNWTDHRRALKKPLTENSAQLCISQLDGFRADGHDPVGVVNASIMNGWQGLFPPRAAPRHANGHVNGHAKPSYSDEIQTAMARAMHNVRGADHDEIPS